MGNQERMEKMRKKIFIVNGKPEAGKDTFENLVLKKVTGIKYSIIDPVKIVLQEIGLWDGKTKDGKIRKLMSDIKIALDEFCDFSFQNVKKYVRDFENDVVPGSVMFIDMREKADIDRAVEEFEATTLYIDNKMNPIISNVADDFASSKDNYNYDIIIDNSGTINELAAKASEFATVLINLGGCDETI